MTIRAFLGYRTLPTTILIVTIYVAAFIAIFIADILPDIPHQGSKKLQGLDLKQARRDLEHVRRVLFSADDSRSLART
jgi:hypothetical protein